MIALTNEHLEEIAADLATINPRSSLVSMKRTDADLLIAFARQTLLAGVPRATLDEHCDHTNLNAEGTRCLSCGMWAHQAVGIGLK